MKHRTEKQEEHSNENTCNKTRTDTFPVVVRINGTEPGVGTIGFFFYFFGIRSGHLTSPVFHCL